MSPRTSTATWRNRRGGLLDGRCHRRQTRQLGRSGCGQSRHGGQRERQRQQSGGAQGAVEDRRDPIDRHVVLLWEVRCEAAVSTGSDCDEPTRSDAETRVKAACELCESGVKRPPRATM